MSIFKSLNPNDKFRIPFNANKFFSFNSSSASTSSVNIYVQTFEYLTSSLNTFSSASTDVFNTVKYYQLDHLFYRNNKLDISNKLGDADYLDENRALYNRVNVLSIPTKLYGNRIKTDTFYYSGSLNTIVDDKKGNLIISGTQLISHSIDERERVFNIGPVNGFKKYNVNYNLYGKTTPNPQTYYNEEHVYDDSFYNNTITYKNILFREIDYGYNAKFPSIDFISDSSITSSIVAPHNETYNFNPDEDFTISMYIKPISASAYLICKSTSETTISTPVYQRSLNTTGSSQTMILKTQDQYPFEIFIDESQKLTFRKTDGTFTPTITASIDTGSIQHIVCMRSASTMEIWITGSKISSGSDTTIFQTENKSNLYIGSKGELSHFYTGSISNLMIFNSSRTTEQIKSLSSSINGSPYIGNIFYSNGLATITHPNYQEIFKPLNAQTERHYPLDGTSTSSIANNNSGSFHDVSRNNQNSTFYVNRTAGNSSTAIITYKSSSQATFETITHNNWTGQLMLFSSSLSSSVGIRGREFVEIPNYLFDRNGKWSISWVMKEANGFHGTESMFMGADLTTSEPTPFNSTLQGFIQFTNNNLLSIRDRSATIITATTSIPNRSASNHCVINFDGSNLSKTTVSFYVNGNFMGSSTKDNSGDLTSGSFGIDALGSGYWDTGHNTYGYSGSLGQVMFFNHLLTTESIQALNNNVGEGAYGNIMNEISFKNIHPIFENEYMCTVNADEYNFTHNISTRKIKSDQKPDLANFVTSSLWKPYITTIGLYNENHELLIVGKLGQPVRMSDETDTTFVLRWDT
jgi:hypothetical protein